VKLLRILERNSNSLQTFNDISQKNITPRAASKILQFYSANRNVGNYTPVLGIQQMLGMKLDTWNIHKTPVDWNFVHENYESVIVGGAGLLHRVFEPFWVDLEKNCRLPIVIWGIGVCLPAKEKNGGVTKEVVGRVFSRSLLVNVRDELTRDYYQLDSKVSITFCPTIVHIANKYQIRTKSGEIKKVLHSHHLDLEPSDATQEIRNSIQERGWHYSFTDNVESKENLLDEVLRMYPANDAIVTTRLHGAIIAYSFRRPYFALSFDPKIDAFVKLYGGGYLAGSMEELKRNFESYQPSSLSNYEAELAKVYEFGKAAKQALIAR